MTVTEYRVVGTLFVVQLYCTIKTTKKSGNNEVNTIYKNFTSFLIFCEKLNKNSSGDRKRIGCICFVHLEKEIKFQIQTCVVARLKTLVFHFVDLMFQKSYFPLSNQ